MIENRKDRLLLAEDYTDLRLEYRDALEKSGFEVSSVKDGGLVIAELKLRGADYFDVLLSDTDMPVMNGPEAVWTALKNNFLDNNRTLIVGMSDSSDNQEYWRGLAHFSCFYDKSRISEKRIGRVVRQCLNNFRNGGLWREVMPEFSY
jgi:CheY-like chemotaxis protein